MISPQPKGRDEAGPSEIGRLINLRFPHGQIELYFENGSIVQVPVRRFPAIQRLRLRQRQDWQILDGVGFTFQDSNEGFHLRNFLVFDGIPQSESSQE